MSIFKLEPVKVSLYGVDLEFYPFSVLDLIAVEETMNRITNSKNVQGSKKALNDVAGILYNQLTAESKKKVEKPEAFLDITTDDLIELAKQLRNKKK